VQTIDRDIRACMLDVISAALSKGDSVENFVERIGKENLSLQRERAQALISAGFPEDYLDIKPVCSRCGDTGYIGSTPCSCLMELYRKEQAKDLSSLLSVGEQCFENFQLKWYDSEKDPSSGVSPREQMSSVYTACKVYAENFGKRSGNLLLTGGPGLGKTFLSACIARRVFEMGFSVVYATSGKIFGDFETARFAKFDDSAAAKGEIRRYEGCDLLIIDDLGTEMTTAFTVSVLYDIINSRLISGKKTVINTNLSISDISSRYSPQIASRLSGEYQVLPFYGRDIRILKKNTK
jgi:DNA replication protein DnaC